MKNLSLLSIIICWAWLSDAQTCDFDYLPTTPCEEGVTLSVVSPQSGSTYGWDVDNNGTIDITGITAFHTFPSAGLFTVSLFENGTLCHTDNVEIFALPDPTIGIAPGTGVLDGSDLRTCTSTPVTTLELTNMSTTILNNTSYTIDWGDGNIDNYTNATFNNAGVNAVHTYTNYGYYTITIDVVSNDGCAASATYNYYNGNNPSIGLATPGNTVSLCSPAAVSFPITDYANNPLGTEYIVYVNGEEVATYDQTNIPSSFTHLFEESSCGEVTSTGNYINAFDVQISASNPCGSSSATVEPIEISLPPDPEIHVDPPSNICVGNTWVFTDTTDASEIISGNPSSCVDLLATWAISPGAPFVDWIVTSGNLSGSSSISVQFLTAGNYTIDMFINSQACGLFTDSESITVVEAPIVDFDTNIAGPDNCASFVANFTNNSSGGSAVFNWSISPLTGWSLVNGTTLNSNDIDVQFDVVGVYEVTLYGNNDCGTYDISQTVEVAGPPELTLNSIPDFCESASINFDNNVYTYIENYDTVTGFNWSFPGGSPASSSLAEPGQVVYDTPGTYTVTLEIENNCGTDIQSTTFTIETPPALAISGPDSLCLTDNPTQLTNNISGGIWSGNGVNSAGEFDPSNAGTGTHQIIYEATVSLCTVFDTLTIEVLPLPTLNISASEVEACINDPAIDLIANPAGGTWTSTGSGTIVGNQFIPGSSGEGNYTLTYAFTDDFGCSNSADLTIEIFGLPDVMASDASFCLSTNTETLPAAFPAGGVWSGPGIVDANNGLFSSIVAGGVGSYSITYSYTDGNTCTNSTDITVDVTPLPVVTMAPDITICEDNPTIDISSMVNPTGGVWSYSGPGLVGTIFNPSIAGPGTYIFTYSYGIGSCNVEENLTINVNGLPSLSIDADDMVCEQVSCLPLSASPSGGFWTSNNGGVILGNCFDPSASGIGNYTLTYNYIDGNGCSNTADLDVEVYSIPQLVVADTFYCEVNADYSLPTPNFTGGVWSGSGVTDPNGNFNPVTAGGAGTYILNYAYSDALGCSNDIDITVTVTPVPVVDLGADQALCLDATPIDLALVASPAGGMFFGSGMTGSVFDPSQTGIGDFEVIYIYGQGSCFSTDTIEITVNPLPVIDLSANIDGICVSESTLVLEASPAGGNWTGNNGAILTGNVFDPNASGIGVYNLTYSYTDANGCENTANWQIEVYDLPEIISSDISFCDLPGEVSLPFASPIGGIWSGPGVTDPAGLFDPALVSGIGSYTLTYTYADNFGCSNSGDFTVTIVAPPAIDAGQDLGICVSAPGYDLSTQAVPAGGTWTGTGITGSIFNPLSTGVGTFELIYTVGTNNCQVWDTIEVEVYDLPVVSTVGNDTEACVALDSMILTATPSGGIWTSTNGGIINGNTFYPNQSGSGIFTLTYTYTDGNNCENSDQFDLTIYDLPNIQIQDMTYCNQGAPVLLPAASPAGGTWSGSGILDASTGLFNPLMSPGIYTVSYEYTDGNGCSNIASADITLIEPVNIIAGPDKSFCVSEPDINLELDASPFGGTWSGAGVTGSMFSPQDAGVGSHEIIYTIGSDNCQVWDTLWIEIFELPTIDISNNEADACVSIDSVYLNASPVGGNWSSPDGGQLYEDIFLPATSGPGVYTLVYSYTNSNNCVSEEQYLFTVNDLPFLTSNDTTYCQSPGIVSLPYASPTGGTWTGPGVVNPAGSFDPMSVPTPGTYALYYSYVDANSCVSSIQIAVEVQELELVEAGPDTILCIDQGVYQMQDYTPTTGGFWSGPGIIDPVNGIFDPSVSGEGIFTIQFDYGNLNCALSDQVQIEVVDWVSQVDPGPDFEVCAYDEDIILSGYTPSGGKWYGEGITNNDEGRFNPVLAGVGSHTLEYIYLDAYSQCEVITERIVTVRPVPSSDFVADEVSCVNTEVNFTNTSDDMFSSAWSITNQGTGSETDLTYVFGETGTYEVLLLSTNAYTCQDSILKTILITETPTPDFEADLDNGCGPLTVNFDNVSFGYDMSFQWDFGNTEFSTNETPDPITYTNGTDIMIYPVRLEVSNLCGSDEYLDTIQVYPSPQVNFGPITNIDCSPMEVTFANATVGLPDYFVWDLGNGNISTDILPEDQLYYAGEDPTDYTITLIASNACGSDTMEQVITVNPPNVDAFMNIPELIGCAPFTPEFNNVSTFGVDYFWDFGDGNTSTAANPEHTYMEEGIYDIVLKVNNNCNFDSITNTITVRPQPTIDFNVDETICLNQTVDFENLSLNAQGFEWNFGDSNTSTLVNPSHTYTSSGNYTISLFGEDSETGCAGTLELPIEVRNLPVAEFTPSDTVSCSPLIVDFENNSTSDIYYTWDFGDGAGSVDSNPNYSFNDPGVHTVSLIAEDLYGCISEPFEFDLFVNPQPLADFMIPALDFCTSAPVEVENLSEDYSSNQWLLNGELISQLTNPVFSFEESGTQTLALQVSNNYNCIDIMERTIEVYQRPVAEFDFDLTEGCAPFEVDLVDLSSNTTDIIWSIDEQALGQNNDDYYTFEEAGVYSVGMIAINTFADCSDTLEILDYINVLPSPTASFEYTDLGDGFIDFTNLSEGYESLLWDFGDQSTSTEVNPQHSYFGNGNWETTLTVTNSYDCTDVYADAIGYDLLYGFYVPNAFSPEFGEGDVRFFKPAGLGVQDYVIEVFAPWGQQLWQSSDLDGEQPAAAWDGIYKGKVMPQGAYAWKASVEFVNGKRKVYNGTVTLLR